EILVLKETTQSWKMTLLLPVLTVPQVVVVAWLINEVTL
ncbi:MAG: ATPase, partial [Oceanicoccus sp.]|nr:ATPase [Oceanicoccus sp.]